MSCFLLLSSCLVSRCSISLLVFLAFVAAPKISVSTALQVTAGWVLSAKHENTFSAKRINCTEPFLNPGPPPSILLVRAPIQIVPECSTVVWWKRVCCKWLGTAILDFTFKEFKTLSGFPLTNTNIHAIIVKNIIINFLVSSKSASAVRWLAKLVRWEIVLRWDEK